MTTLFDRLSIKILQTLCSRAICSFGLIFITYVLSRNVNLSQLGNFASITSLVLLISLISRAGGSTHLIKICGIYLPKGKLKELNQAISDLSKFAIYCSGLLSIFVAFVLIFYSAYDPWFALLIMCSPGVSVLYYVSAIFRGADKSYLAPLAEFGSLSLFVSLLIVAANFLGYVIAIKVLCIIYFFLTYTLAIIALRVVKKFIPSTSELKPWTASSWVRYQKVNYRYFITEFSQYFSQYGFMLVAAACLQAAQVAQFSIIQQLAFTINFVLGVSANTIASKVARYGGDYNYNGIALIKKKTQLLMLFWLLPISSILFIFAPSFTALFGVSSEEVIFLLRILVVVQVCNALSGLSLTILNLTGNENVVSRISILVVLLQFSLGVIFTTKFGLFGLVMAFSFSILLRNILANFFEYKRYKDNKNYAG